jgi:hypothetical protein
MKFPRLKKYQMGGSTDPILNTGMFSTDRVGSKINFEHNVIPSQEGGWMGSMADLQPEGSTKVQLDNPHANYTNNMAGMVGNGPGPTPAKKFDFSQVGQNAGKFLPYISNVVNAFRRLPKPIKPELEANMSADLVNYDNDRVEMDKQFAGLNKGAQASSANPAFANANRAAAFGKVLDTKAKIAQMERNTNAQIKNNTREANSRINARNTERNNSYNESLVARTIAQQQHNAQNLANFSDKVQLEKRDKAEMALERDRLDIIPRVYNDTGVVDRNVMDLLIAQKEKLGEKKRYGGTIKRYFNSK